MLVRITSQYKEGPDRVSLRYSQASLNEIVRALKRKPECVSFQVYNLEGYTGQGHKISEWKR